MQRNSRPLVWRPKGLSDVLDSSGAFQGAMSSLQNLIPDPSTPELWQCRPASLNLTSGLGSLGGPWSSGFSSGFGPLSGSGGQGFVSCMLIVGTLAFGMVGDGTGLDRPFCFNLQTNLFIVVTGTQNNTTLPISPVTTGEWTPPEMAVIGSRLVVTHLGFNGPAGAAGNFFGYFDIANPLAPVWHGANFTGPAGLTFTIAPQSVTQFNGRAYFIENIVAQPAVIWSDVNNPLTNTGSVTPVLTFGDNVPLTTLQGLPLNNQLGGIIQSVMVFKGATNIYQITGDASTSNLSVNSLNVQTGTFASNTVTPTPKGLAFIAPDGLRIIDFQAHVSDPIGIDGQGVNVPFVDVVNPTRMNMSCNSNVLRVSLFNGNVSGAPAQEYWFDFARKIFSGPHTFPASIIQPFLNTFILAPVGILGSLWRSDTIQSLTSTFVENSVQMTFAFFTSFLPDTDQMVNNCMTESTLEVALPPGGIPLQVVAVNADSSVLDTLTLLSTAGLATQWGSFVWGAAAWGGSAAPLKNLQLQWHQPLVFDRLQVQVSGQSSQSLKLGSLKGRYQQLRTLTNIQAVA